MRRLTCEHRTSLIFGGKGVDQNASTSTIWLDALGSDASDDENPLVLWSTVDWIRPPDLERIEDRRIAAAHEGDSNSAWTAIAECCDGMPISPLRLSISTRKLTLSEATETATDPLLLEMQLDLAAFLPSGAILQVSTVATDWDELSTNLRALIELELRLDVPPEVADHVELSEILLMPPAVHDLWSWLATSEEASRSLQERPPDRADIGASIWTATASGGLASISPTDAGPLGPSSTGPADSSRTTCLAPTGGTLTIDQLLTGDCAVVRRIFPVSDPRAGGHCVAVVDDAVLVVDGSATQRLDRPIVLGLHHPAIRKVNAGAHIWRTPTYVGPMVRLTMAENVAIG